MMNVIADINTAGDNWIQVTLSGPSIATLTEDVIEQLFQSLPEPATGTPGEDTAAAHGEPVNSREPGEFGDGVTVMRED